MKRGNKRKFGRTTDVRNAFLRALSTALIEHGSITTTKARAKSLRVHIEKLVTTAKPATVAARRLLAKDLGTAAVKKLVDQIAPTMSERAGGYTRIISLGRRLSDGSEEAVIQFIS